MLADESPDGAQSVITRGFMNLNHRNGAKAPEPVTPGEEMEVSFPLHAMAWRVPANHRLMLYISSTYWPVCWPSPEPVTLTLAPGRSKLELPRELQPARLSHARFPCRPPRRAASPRCVRGHWNEAIQPI